MLEEEILQPLKRVLDILEKMAEEKGVPQGNSLVDKNIIKSSNSTFDKKHKISAVLTSTEQRRYTAIFTLFSDIFLDMQADRKDPQTLATSIADRERKRSEPSVEDKKKSGFFNIVSMLVAGMALVTMAIPALVSMLFEKVGFLKTAMAFLGKVGLQGGLTLMLKALGAALKPVLKRVPIIGSLISFYMAYEEFKNNRPVPAILQLVSGLLNLVPGVGTMLSVGVDILNAYLDYKGYYNEDGALSGKNAWNTIKGWGAKIWNDYIKPNALYLPILAPIMRFSLAKDAFESGDFKGGIKEILLGLLSIAPVGGPMIKGYEMLMGWLESEKEKGNDHLGVAKGWMDSLKKWIASKLKDLPYVLRKPLEWFGIIPDTDNASDEGLSGVEGSAKSGFEKAKGWFSDMWSSLKGPVSDGMEKIKGFASKAFEILKDPQTYEKIKEFSKNIYDSISETASKTWEKTKEYSAIVWEKMGGAWEKTVEAAGNFGKWFAESVSKVAGKIKDMADDWIPPIIDSISAIAAKAKDVLSGMAKKIGGWIAGLFSSDEETKIKDQLAGNGSTFTKESYEGKMLEYSYDSAYHLNLLNSTAKVQAAYLERLFNVAVEQLTELRRLRSVSGGGGGSTAINIPSSPPEGNSLVGVTYNRTGYGNSPYSIGAIK